jgi:hypothetical protein
MKKFVVLALLALSLIPLAAPAARANVPSYEQRHDAKAFAQWYWRDYRGLDNPCPYGVKLRFERMPARMAGVLGFHAATRARSTSTSGATGGGTACAGS